MPWKKRLIKEWIWLVCAGAASFIIMGVLKNLTLIPFKSCIINSSKHIICEDDDYFAMLLIFVIIYGIRVIIWSIKKVKWSN